MAHLRACPRCGRTLKNTLLGGAYFPVYTCGKCKTKYCSKCGGSSCPKCGATARGHYDDVYAR
ncbi:MAG TPA: hypothetical protein QGF58_28255 [Myxococcota bacterium]|nr:hypothetical protein [Myxococcota bacterium]